MSEIKHPIKPWHWDDDVVWQEGYDTEQHAPWLVSPGGEVVLRGQIYCCRESYAHLIAAAPELLEAATEAEKWLVLLEADKIGKQGMQSIVKLRAAIAKARGQS